jgi:hypothetical protein
MLCLRCSALAAGSMLSQLITTFLRFQGPVSANSLHDAILFDVLCKLVLFRDNIGELFYVCDSV